MNFELSATPLVHLQWPQNVSLSFSEACARLGLDDDFNLIQSDLRSLAALTTAMAPVVGITGTLNAGKTSTVKKFLSPIGRERAPSGTGKQCGTQRFVFWLPTSWKSQPDVWEAFKGGLEALFGNTLEELSEDPEVANRQYRGHGDVTAKMAIPLYAFDEGLDEFGFALMDSPDMERSLEGVEHERPSEIRKEFVRKALRGLSAVLVLCEASKAELELLARLLSNNAGVPVFLLLNQIDCSPGELSCIINDEGVAELQSALSVSRIHAAFHGRFEGAREAIAEILGTDEFDANLPQFFRVFPPHNPEEPHVLLENELRALEPAQLWRDKIEAKRADLQSDIERCTDKVHKKLHEHRIELEKLRDAVIQFVRDQVVADEKNELATPLLPSTAAQIAQAVTEHSPIYAKPTMHLHRQFTSGLQYLKNRVDNYKAMREPDEAIRKKVSEVRKEIKNKNISSFNPERWATRSRSHKFMPDDVGKETLVDLWTQVGDQAIDRDVDLDQDVLKRFAHGLWASVPWWKKFGVAVFGPVFVIGAVLTLVVAVFDGGASSVLLFSGLKELLVFLGLGSAVTPAFMAAGGKALEADLVKRAAIPFYANLVKGALDSFGLPRTELGPVKDAFSNTGDFVLDLDNSDSYHPIKSIVDLSAGRVLGEIRKDAVIRLLSETAELQVEPQSS